MSTPGTAAPNHPSVIDAHVHFVPPGYAGHDDSNRFRPQIRIEDDRQVEVRVNGRSVDSVLGEFSRIEVLQSELTLAHCDGAVLSPWVATFPRDIGDSEAASLCRLQNDAMAEVVRSGGGRFAGLGALPLQAPMLAAAVLEEAMAAGLAGVELPAVAAGRGLGDPALEPLWSAAEELGALMFVHPGSQGLAMDLLGGHYLWNSVGNPVETAVSAAELVMNGVFDRHPDLVILLAHGGGVLPALASRMGRAWRQRPEARSDSSVTPEESIRRFYFDSVLHDPQLLAHLVGFAGADHVLLGSDHPFDMGLDDPVGAIRALGLPEHDELAVLGGNARRLAFGVPPRAGGIDDAPPAKRP